MEGLEVTNSRDKGARAEREASAEWERLFGVQMRRSQQYCGRSDESDDIVGQPGVSIEVKRRERLNLAEAIKQCAADAKEGNVPIVLHRSNGNPWLVTVRLDDLPQLANVLFLTLAGIGKTKAEGEE